MKSFRKNVKAVSPVLSVLMMIAVAVAASLVTYAWVMGYLGFTTAKVGKAIQIQSIAKDGSGNLLVYVQNVGQGSIKLTNIYIGGKAPTTFTLNPTDGVLAEGATGYWTVSSPLVSGMITVRVNTQDGTFTEGTATV
jgi:flagellin-like protein